MFRAPPRRLILAPALSLAVGAIAAAISLGAGPLSPIAEPSATPSAAAPRPRPSLEPASFDAQRAYAHVEYLADPARAGRLTGSRGYDEAAAYVADRFREIGLEPLGDEGTYFQRFQTTVVELTAMPELEVVGRDPHPFVVRRDFSELVGGRRGGGSVEAEVVFVGSGLDTAEYSDYRDVDPRGKIVLVSGPSQGDPLLAAIRRGAVGALFVGGQGPLLHFSYIPVFEAGAIPTVVVTEAVADRLIASSGNRIADLRRALAERLATETAPPGASAAQPLSFATGTRVRLSVSLGPVRTVEAANVVGLLPAPADGDRYVLVGGHLDGVGTDPDGTVYPGANDNASGVAVTIELARALSSQREALRAGIVFVAFAGEEEGLRGSEAFIRRTAISPYRTGNLLAYLNLDVVGCCGTTLAATDEGSPLHGRIADAAARNGMRFTATSGNSDHVSFQRRGVRAATLIWSSTGPIHTPDDTVALVEPESLRGLGVVATQVALELATAE